MDHSRFDALTRSLSSAGSRRRALSGVLAGTLGLLGWHEGNEIVAHDLKDTCKKKSGGAKKKCLKKAKKHKAEHAAETQPPPPPLPCGAGGPCRVFATSTPYSGNLGGLSGADDKCQLRALVAGLPGTYRAWLSDATGSPSTRFVRSTGPYQLVNGTTIAANWADLTDGALAAPINVTETGGAVRVSDLAWTATKTNGTFNQLVNYNCVNWSTAAVTGFGLAGIPTEASGAWTEEFLAASCGEPNVHLYCFQQS
jgi:hypothetical protein